MEKNKSRAISGATLASILQRFYVRPSMLLFLAFLGTLCCLEIWSFKQYLDTSGYNLNQVEYVFYIVFNGCNISFSSIIFLLICSNNDSKRDSFPAINYCFLATLTAVVAVLVFAFLFSLPFSEKNSGWTEPSLVRQQLISATVVPAFVCLTMDPIAAILRSTAIIFLYWFSTSLLLLLFQKLDRLEVGTGLFVMLNFARYILMYDKYPTYLPDSRSTYKIIAILASQGKENEQYWVSIQYYIAAILGLLVATKYVPQGVKRLTVKRKTRNDWRFH